MKNPSFFHAHFRALFICAVNKAQGVCIREPLKRNEVTGSCPRCKYPKPNSQAAFSLVEMLMALLVASLLLAALAPVMTKKFGADDVSLSGGFGYERMDYGRPFYQDAEWAVPAGVNILKITAVGGGGAGGSATYGYKKFTYSGSAQTFVVPDGVTKIRVYALAGGGGGAAGGDGANVAYGTLPASGKAEYTTPGTNQTWDVPNNAKIPEINADCKTSGVSNWTLTSDNKTVMPPGNAYINVLACGGGGGPGRNWSDTTCAGKSGSGGSGGKVDATFQLDKSVTKVYITVGGGGGMGSTNGSSNTSSNSINICDSTSAAGYGGGGGGCETFFTDAQPTLSQGNGTGGNGGWIPNNCNLTYLAVVNAGNGSGTSGGGSAGTGIATGTEYTDRRTRCFASAGWGSLEGGGGGGGATHWGGGGGGGGATFFGRYGNSSDSKFFLVAPGGGGGSKTHIDCTAFGGTATAPGGGGGGNGGGAGGGGLYTGNDFAGKGGTGGNNGNITTQMSTTAAGGASPIGNSNYCAGGGTNSQNGKNGYLKVSWTNTSNLLKCNYIKKTNAGGGGGAGQIWIGEITVVPGETVTVTPGKGGNGGATRGSNGSNGANTVISGSKSGAIITLFGGAGGNYSTSISTGGAGAGYSTQKAWKNWTGQSVFDETNLSALSLAGNGIAGANASENNFAGGNGGATYSLDNSPYEPGIGGGANSNGSAPVSTSYGTGGGGGGGNASFTSNTAGLGGNGGNGYVYFEWGEGSGGGGQTGQVVTKSGIWVSGGVSKVKITIGKGGASTQATSLNYSGLAGQKGGRGEDTVIEIDNKTVLTAKGGYGGNPGVFSNGTGGGKGEGETETIKDTVAGDDGTDENGGAGAALVQTIFPLLEAVDGVKSTGGLGGSISTSGEGKAGSGVGAGGGGGIFLNNKAYLGGKGAGGMVYIEYSN